jgi:hypothetical protein
MSHKNSLKSLSLSLHKKSPSLSLGLPSLAQKKTQDIFWLAMQIFFGYK